MIAKLSQRLSHQIKQHNRSYCSRHTRILNHTLKHRYSNHSHNNQNQNPNQNDSYNHNYNNNYSRSFYSSSSGFNDSSSTAQSYQYFRNRTFCSAPSTNTNTNQSNSSKDRQSKPKGDTTNNKTVKKRIAHTQYTRYDEDSGQVVTDTTTVFAQETSVNRDERSINMKWEEISDSTEVKDTANPHLAGQSTETTTYKEMKIEASDFSDEHVEIHSRNENTGVLNADGTPVNPVLNAPKKRKKKKIQIQGQGPEYDIFTVGNPTERELEWRRLQLTPHSLVIHGSRLLPVLAHKKQKQQSYSQRIQTFVREKIESMRKTIRANEKFSDYEQQVTDTWSDASQSWDTSQNYYLVRFRSLIDRMNLQTEPSRALEIMRDTFNEDFWVEDFLPQFKEEMLPFIIQAFLSEDVEYLNLVCCNEALVFCTNMIKARETANIKMDEKILWIEDPQLIDTKIVDKLPQMIVHVVAQIIDCTYDRTTLDIVDGNKGYVAHQNFVLSLQPCMDPEYLKQIPFPIQVRSLQTSKVRALV